MRYLIVLLFMFFCTSVLVKAQDDNDGRRPFKKLDKLEQIKLIEALKMNEETSVRFFARQQEHKRKVRDYEHQSREIMNKLKKDLEDKPEKSSSELKKLTDEYLKLLVQIQKERMSFINSLSDILTTEQIARLLVFEKTFRDEIRNLLYKERFKDKK